jgi:prepilin-type N-terminal cleavage/methylation domain-containing protein
MASTGLRGFTLLEMLVVMVLMGLITTLALPAMQRWHDAIQAKAQAAVVIDALRAAAFAAGAGRRTVAMEGGSFKVTDQTTQDAAPSQGKPVAAEQAPATAGASSEPPPLQVNLPPGWRVDRVQPAQFLANGLCTPGSVSLKTASGELVVIEVRGPVCGVELTAPGSRG